MATTHIILGIICSIGIIGHGLPHRNLLATPAQQKILDIALSQLDVRETERNNFGKEIKAYLMYTRLKEGNPYCAAFVSWVYFKAGHAQPKTAWSPDMFPLNRIIEHSQPAAVLGIYSIARGRIVHCGLVERWQNDWVISIEGNTTVNGSEVGNARLPQTQGVYRKWRHKRTIAKYADWLKK